MNRSDSSPTVIAPLLLRPNDAARALAISPRKLWELTNQGQIKAVRDGRIIRYAMTDLHAWIDSRRGYSHDR